MTTRTPPKSPSSLAPLIRWEVSGVWEHWRIIHRVVEARTEREAKAAFRRKVKGRVTTVQAHIAAVNAPLS